MTPKERQNIISLIQSNTQANIDTAFMLCLGAGMSVEDAVDLWLDNMVVMSREYEVTNTHLGYVVTFLPPLIGKMKLSDDIFAEMDGKQSISEIVKKEIAENIEYIINPIKEKLKLATA